jgi:membrane protein insertase Oxa1/YidC/SpoIIIJ
MPPTHRKVLHCIAKWASSSSTVVSLQVSAETSALYEEAGVNPAAGCLPALATIPIFIGLYSSLTNAANAGLFEDQVRSWAHDEGVWGWLRGR